MIGKMVVGGLFGIAIGIVAGWFAFDSIGSGVAVGFIIAIGICGVLAAYAYGERP